MNAFVLGVAVLVLTGIGIAAALALIAYGASAAGAAFQPTVDNEIVELPSRNGGRPVAHLDAPILEARHVRKAVPSRRPGFGAKVVLANASLALYPGDLACLTAPNGRGKSTLFQIMGLIQRPSGGEIVIGGHPTAAVSEVERNSIRSAYIHHIPYDRLGLLPRSPIENITYLMTLLDGAPLSRARERAAAALAQAGLSPDKYDEIVNAATFSSGELGRVAVAVAIARAKPIVLADEIFANLDPPSKVAIFEQFAQLAREGAAVAIITHDDQLWDRFDRHFVLGGATPADSAQAVSA